MRVEVMIKLSRAVLCAVIVLATGCTSSTLRTPLSPASMMSNSMDITMGPMTHAAEQNLIIVLMNFDFHRHLSHGGNVSREDRLPPRYATYVSRLARAHNMVRVADWPLASIQSRCLVFQAQDIAQRDQIVARLNGEPGVEHAQALQYFETEGSQAGMQYNDPYLDMQHGLHSLQVLESHRWATGEGVRVAVVDTGLDHRHADLHEQVVQRKNFVDRKQSEFRGDVHGTAVAGLIVAQPNNGVGLVGVAPHAEILALKSCWQQTEPGTSATCSSFTLAKALNFAIQERVDVINLSLSGPQDALLERLVANAIERGIVVVGAVHPVAEMQFPASIPHVIAVSQLEGASGADQPRQLRAPGKQILTTLPNNSYEFQSGSSFATAQVSGIVALIRQHKPHLSPQVVKELLLRTANNGSVSSCRALAQYVPVDCGD